MGFDTNEITDRPAKKYVKPGENEDVQIGEIIGERPEGKSPYIDVHFFIKGTDPSTANRSRIYMSDSAVKKSLEKLKHLATKVVTAEQFDAAGAKVEGNDVVQYAKYLNTLLNGKVIPVMIFGAQEYKNGNGQTKVRPMLLLPPFAVSNKADRGTLKYDPTNKYHYVKLVTPDAETASVPNDLPF